MKLKKYFRNIFNSYFIYNNIFYLLIIKSIKKKNEIVKIFNNGANILITIFTILLIAITNFSKAFVIFHKIFLKMTTGFSMKKQINYKSVTRRCFKLYAIIIVALIVIFIIIYKILYYKSKKGL